MHTNTVKFQRELMLSMSIVKRMKPRNDSNVYQSSAYNLSAFPLILAENLFSEDVVTQKSPTSKTYGVC